MVAVVIVFVVLVVGVLIFGLFCRRSVAAAIVAAPMGQVELQQQIVDVR